MKYDWNKKEDIDKFVDHVYENRNRLNDVETSLRKLFDSIPKTDEALINVIGAMKHKWYPKLIGLVEVLEKFLPKFDEVLSRNNTPSKQKRSNLHLN